MMNGKAAPTSQNHVGEQTCNRRGEKQSDNNPKPLFSLKPVFFLPTYEHANWNQHWISIGPSFNDSVNLGQMLASDPDN